MGHHSEIPKEGRAMSKWAAGLLRPSAGAYVTKEGHSDRKAFTRIYHQIPMVGTEGADIEYAGSIGHSISGLW